MGLKTGSSFQLISNTIAPIILLVPAPCFSMRTIIAAILIPCLVQATEEVKATQSTNGEDALDKVDADELMKMLMDKLSDRLLQSLPLEDSAQDTDMDGTTLGKPGAMAAPASGLKTLPASRPVQPFLRQGNMMSRSSEPEAPEEGALTPDQTRRAMTQMMAGLALLPLALLAGEADAKSGPVKYGTSSDPYVQALVTKSKENMEKNNEERYQTAQWNAKRFSMELNNALKDVKSPNRGWPDVEAKVARDKAVVSGNAR